MGELEREWIDIPDSIEDLAHSVIGAAIEVHKELGPGFLESVYESALATELDYSEIPFERQKSIDLFYRNQHAGSCRLDFLVSDSLVLELKSVRETTPIHRAQTLSYVKACQLPLGLLINFNHRKLVEGVTRILNFELIQKKFSN
jgi:GxxExxY protein